MRRHNVPLGEALQLLLSTNPAATVMTFGTSDRWFNYNSVDISFRQAGFEEFRPRRFIHRGAEPLDIDDRQYNLVFGHYDIPAHTAYLWACGPNMSDHVPVDRQIVAR